MRAQKSQEKHSVFSPLLHMLPHGNARLTTATNPKTQLQMRAQKSQEKHRCSSPLLHMLPLDNARFTKAENSETQLQFRGAKPLHFHIFIFSHLPSGRQFYKLASSSPALHILYKFTYIISIRLNK